MTNRAPIALMAAALFLAVQGQPRSEQPPTLLEVFLAVQCPCGNPRELIPNLGDWLGVVECVGTTQFAGGVSLVSKPVGLGGGNMKLGLFSRGVGYKEGRIVTNCLYFEDGGVAGKGQSGMSKAQSVACSRLIIDYAQELKDEDSVKIVDLGCNLK